MRARMATLLALVLGLIASLAGLIWLRRPHLGHLVITTDDPRSFSFVTDFGRFRVEREKGELTARDPSGTTRSILLAQIERIDYARPERWRAPPEVQRERGPSLLRVAAYADRMDWLTLSLVLAGGEEVLLYAVGQLEPREGWLRRAFALEARMLAKLGLVRDIEYTACRALERIQSGFAQSGRELGLS